MRFNSVYMHISPIYLCEYIVGKPSRTQFYFCTQWVSAKGQRPHTDWWTSAVHWRRKQTQRDKQNLNLDTVVVNISSRKRLRLRKWSHCLYWLYTFSNEYKRNKRACSWWRLGPAGLSLKTVPQKKNHNLYNNTSICQLMTFTKYFSNSFSTHFIFFEILHYFGSDRPLPLLAAHLSSTHALPLCLYLEVRWTQMLVTWWSESSTETQNDYGWCHGFMHSSSGYIHSMATTGVQDQHMSGPVRICC